MALLTNCKEIFRIRSYLDPILRPQNTTLSAVFATSKQNNRTQPQSGWIFVSSDQQFSSYVLIPVGVFFLVGLMSSAQGNPHFSHFGLFPGASAHIRSRSLLFYNRILFKSPRIRSSTLEGSTKRPKRSQRTMQCRRPANQGMESTRPSQVSSDRATEWASMSPKESVQQQRRCGLDFDESFESHSSNR